MSTSGLCTDRYGNEHVKIQEHKVCGEDSHGALTVKLVPDDRYEDQS